MHRNHHVALGRTFKAAINLSVLFQTWSTLGDRHTGGAGEETDRLEKTFMDFF